MTFGHNSRKNLSYLGMWNPIPGVFGVELEIEGLNLPKSAAGWTVKAEGSLRGANNREVIKGEDQPDTPREYAVVGAVDYTELEKRLIHLNRLLTRGSTVVKLTPRASTHIHLNMQSAAAEQIYGFITAFTIIEPVLLRLCGQHRNGNLFCLPSYDTGDLPLFMGNVGRAMKEGLECWPRGSASRGKYAALNTDTLMTFGTLEIRCFPNTIEPKDILTWAKYLLNIRDYVYDEPDKTYKNMVLRAYEEPGEILAKVFGETPLFQPCAPDNPKDLTRAGAEIAWEIYRNVADNFVRSNKERSSTTYYHDEAA